MSIMQTDKECFITGATENLDKHHIPRPPAKGRRSLGMLDLAAA